MMSTGKPKQKFIKTLISLPYGVPSYDRINLVFSAIVPKKFELYFINWASYLNDYTKKQLTEFQHKINERPIEKLNFDSPKNFFYKW